jgi:hypothetical protein
MHVLVHIYITFLIFFYCFIVVIRYWDDYFGESADIRSSFPSAFPPTSATPTAYSQGLGPAFFGGETGRGQRAILSRLGVFRF